MVNFISSFHFEFWQTNKNKFNEKNKKHTRQHLEFPVSSYKLITIFLGWQ